MKKGSATEHFEWHPVYEKMIRVALSIDPISNLEGVLRPDFMGYGTAAHEFFQSREQFLEAVRVQQKQLKGKEVTRTRRPVTQQVMAKGQVCLVVEEVEVYVKDLDHRLKGRISTLLEKSGGKWWVTHFHGSTPDSDIAEGESFPMEGLQKKNAELEAKIRERTRDMEIEAALERTRAQSMQMQHSDELSAVSKAFHEQLLGLGIDSEFSFVWLPNEAENTHIFWSTWADGSKNSPQYHSRTAVYPMDKTEPYTAACFADWKSGVAVHEHFVKPKDIEPFFAAWTELLEGAEGLQAEHFKEGIYYTEAFMKYGCFGIDIRRPLTEEEKTILHRFAKEFERAYTRFLDLQKAEAQAREARIEAALERVRSRSMAMHKSEELAEVAAVLYNELLKLEVSAFSVASIVVFDEPNNQQIVWGSQTESEALQKSILPLLGDEVLQEIYDNWLSGEALFSVKVGGIAFENHKDFVFPRAERTELVDRFLKNMPDPTFFHCAVFSMGYLELVSDRELPDESASVLKRFARVFEQTYTRFLDLQKAEAQAREARVEMALERIRSQVTGMQESADLLDIVVSMRNEFVNLGHEAHYFWYMRWLPEIYEKAMTSGDGTRIGMVMKLPRHIHGEIPLVADWEQSDQPTVVYTMDADAAIAYVDKMVELGDFQQIDPQAPSHDDIRHIGGLTFVMARTTHGEIGYSLPGIVPDPPAEDLETLVRFAGVFDLAYRRFEDLQESERQKREAEIELALERVRSRTMGMQSSDELREVVLVINEQLDRLNFGSNACNIIVIDRATGDSTYWVSGFAKDIYPVSYHVPYLDHPYYEALLNPWKRGDRYVVYEYSGQYKKDFEKISFARSGFRDVPADAKKVMESLPFVILSTAYFSNGALQVIGPKALSEEKAQILQRFAKVFDQTYTRFLDLKKAEEQAREARIEAALERVRARTMAMQHTDELSEASLLLDQQVRALGIATRGCAFHIYRESDSLEWFGDDFNAMEPYPVPRVGIFKKYYEAGMTGDALYCDSFEGEACRELYEFLGSLPVIGEGLKKAQEAGLVFPEKQYDHVAYFKYGYLLFITLEPVAAEDKNIFIRFAAVFEQTYTRFLDLQKAEAQAREARIETGLERVRAGMMAMHKSDELRLVIKTIFEQLQELNFGADASAVIIYDDNDAAEHWFSGYSYETYPKSYTIPYIKTFRYNTDLVDAWKNGVTFQAFPMEGKEKTDYGHWLLENTDFKDLPEEFTIHAITPDRLVLNDAFNKYGMLEVLGPEELSSESADILIRFSKVFEQTYTRFLDLKKAETQAREAQIETALERVRSRSMAMQTSEELQEVIRVIFGQMTQLNINAEHAGIVVDYSPGQDWNFWVADKQDIPSRITVPYLDLPWDRQFAEAREKGIDFFTTHLNFEEKNSFYQKLLQHIPGVTREARDFYFSCPGLAASTVLQEDVALYIENFSGTPYSDEENKILRRFGKVFQQTYTRFLDLQKAEAQAREARIEAALEKVRSRTMAMQHSDELPEAANVLFLEIQALGIPAWSCGYNVLAADKKTAQCWMSSEGTIQKPFTLRLQGEASFDAWEDFIQGDLPFLVQELGGQALESHYTFMKSFPDLEPIFADIEAAGLSLPTYQINHLCKFTHGFLLFITYEAVADSHDIFKRFSAVFEQTYTRFLDLKKVEAQAREARIETALERVRARALAMQQPEELKDVAQVLRREMGLLGVEELETSSIYINDLEADKAECWYAIKDLREAEKVMVADHFALDLHDTWVGREMLKFFESDANQVSIIMKGKQRREWIDYCEAQSEPLRGYYGKEVPDRTYHLYKFSHGAIGVATAGELSGESWGLLRRAASVFSLAYSRFRDLTQARLDLQKLKEEKKRAEDALAELQLTQKQLVHAEKMASLGELTAGIAHEIQNPLNFVNNFSEVSRELLEEMIEELKKGDAEEADAIARDVIQNLEKIVHHGKRADGIVKGMLQHSRSGDGQKQPTDLNKLADEYLRLAYHGLRAKDKSFNASMETGFDPKLPQVSVVPQDIGRVLLNLVTNAFHAVSERKASAPEGFEPTVGVRTRNTPEGVEIAVIDNGNGIPEAIMDKIFQPFFTTKPTGQGTGLGLSMSYDIVTKGHGGQLKVGSKPGEGTEFIVIFPV